MYHQCSNCKIIYSEEEISFYVDLGVWLCHECYANMLEYSQAIQNASF